MRLHHSLAILSCLLIGAPALGQPEIEADRDHRGLGIHSFSMGVGLINPETGSTSGTVMTGFDMGDLADRISLHPGVEYWKATSEALDTKVETRDLTVAADVRYTIGSGSTAPYLGLGPALHVLRSEATSAGVETAQTNTRAGFGVLAGLRFRNQETFSWFAEAKYRWVQDLDSFRAFGGVTLNL